MRQRQFTKSLSVALSQEQFEQIKQITDEEQISMAEWVRKAVIAAIRSIQEEVLNNENN